MRISDWSSDVCSSDLVGGMGDGAGCGALALHVHAGTVGGIGGLGLGLRDHRQPHLWPEACRAGRLPPVRDKGSMIGGNLGFARVERGNLLFRRARHIARCAALGQRRLDLGATRSEEHTSELQSLMRTSYAVFCLQKTNTLTTSHIQFKHE